LRRKKGESGPQTPFRFSPHRNINRPGKGGEREKRIQRRRRKRTEEEEKKGGAVANASNFSHLFF